MNKKIKLIAKISLLISALAFAWIALNFTHVRSFPKIISSYYAKEFCSCYYIVKQSEEFCHNYTRQWVPISEFNHDKEKKKITVKGLFFENSAQFINDKDGCSYVENSPNRK